MRSALAGRCYCQQNGLYCYWRGEKIMYMSEKWKISDRRIRIVLQEDG